MHRHAGARCQAVSGRQRRIRRWCRVCRRAATAGAPVSEHGWAGDPGQEQGLPGPASGPAASGSRPPALSRWLLQRQRLARGRASCHSDAGAVLAVSLITWGGLHGEVVPKMPATRRAEPLGDREE